MSSAHRPTWNAAEGRADERHKSARVAARHMPSHTKLKFRQPQQGGQASSQIHRDDRVRRDLRKELELAERESRNKRRKQQGLAPEKEDISEEDAEEEQGKVLEDRSVEDEDLKRRKLIEEMKKLDEDDVDSDSGSSEQASKNKGKAKATNGVSDSSDDSSSSDDDDDDEDETAALLRELEKIKRERAEEKARQERERAQMEQSSREDEIALGNPLLNLENAMKGGSGKSRGSNGVASFGVKRRWDDDVVFKNQAAGNEKEKDGFVNDLTRSEFHKRFLQRFIR